MWLSVLEVGEWPIVPRPLDPPPMHFRTYSDASGEILDTPSTGMLIPAQFGLKPRVASWEFPKGFLDSVDEKDCKCFRKTTCLETLGILCTLLLAPDLLGGHSVIKESFYVGVYPRLQWWPFSTRFVSARVKLQQWR